MKGKKELGNFFSPHQQRCSSTVPFQRKYAEPEDNGASFKAATLFLFWCLCREISAAVLHHEKKVFCFAGVRKEKRRNKAKATTKRKTHRSKKEKRLHDVASLFVASFQAPHPHPRLQASSHAASACSAAFIAYFFGALLGAGTRSFFSDMNSCTWHGLHMYGVMRPWARNVRRRMRAAWST